MLNLIRYLIANDFNVRITKSINMHLFQKDASVFVKIINTDSYKNYNVDYCLDRLHRNIHLNNYRLNSNDSYAEYFDTVLETG